MIEITLTQVDVAIGTSPMLGVRALVLTDPQSGIRVVAPLDRLAAIKIGHMLSTGLDMPDPLPAGKDN